ncbi:MAG: NAD(P)-dependent oxidoreductase, partial [Acidobacteriia bacterium]|nr:NAD(P)-dependent oxidoreductase [Terriglobia bacterium]
MKVFVAGATGAIGLPLVSALIAARHEVIGMTSKEAGLQSLRQAGADGVVIDALNSEAVYAALAKIRPEAVVEELTSLPKRYTPEEMRAARPRDSKLRLEGGANVQKAATAAGARRYVVQSTGFFYGPGPGLAIETDSLALDAPPGIAATVRTYTEIEKRVLGTPGLNGTALRYGFFYGPGTYHDPLSGSISQQLQE